MSVERLRRIGDQPENRNSEKIREVSFYDNKILTFKHMIIEGSVITIYGYAPDRVQPFVGGKVSLNKTLML